MIYTYDIPMPDGTTLDWAGTENKPYMVFDVRRTGNYVYNYWAFKTPSGASKKYRALQEWKQAMIADFSNFDPTESTFVLASPKEMD